MTERVQCAIIRGGTSKAVFLHSPDLPADPAQRDGLLLRIFGSPDLRQIDGLGGADPLTSKCAIVGGSQDSDFDLDYLFAQVAIDRAYVDYHSVCGNISAGLGVYALWRGLSAADGDTVTFRVRVLNSDGAWLEVTTPVEDDVARTTGDFAIAGVPGTAAQIMLNLAGLTGAQLGGVFPTGRRAELLAVPGLGELEVTLMDVGNPHVFVAAAAVGLTGRESAADLDADAALAEQLERVRAVAAHRLGLVASPEDATSLSPVLPILAMVAPPQAYLAQSGEVVGADRSDLLGRLMFMQRAHKAYAGTSTACTGAAARIDGTTVHTVSRATPGPEGTVRIGHPSGIVETRSAVVLDEHVTVLEASVARTARLLMSGHAYV